MSPRIFFRTVAIAEAVTWTLLIIGLILKYVVDAGDLGVRIGGSIHGFVFLVYAASAVVVGLNQRWSVPTIAAGVASAVIPYATIPFDVWADRTGRLDGAWRIEQTDDPRDARWFDRTLRWFLGHPVVFGAIFVVGVVVVFSALLVGGPPVPKG
ncbi:DUF3817 domain-containing protein [Plantibacter sp. Mn2098]|uniref:DUF3817 domain-containing protein n=1 Tax=Plantibacter sp. Mn2098 TaxID=3395266 RepID=UPI003BE20F4F